MAWSSIRVLTVLPCVSTSTRSIFIGSECEVMCVSKHTNIFSKLDFIAQRRLLEPFRILLVLSTLTFSMSVL